MTAHMWAILSRPYTERSTRNGFTIVELLIVVVVIGTLTAITILTYNGIQSRTRTATIQSDLNGAAKTLEIANTTNGSYPATLLAANLRFSSGTVYGYNYNTSSNTYCLSATNSTIIYSVVAGNSTFQVGGCTTAGLVGWWKFNGNANDSSAGSNNGTVTSAALTTGQNLQSNSAYVFNGSTAHIVLADIDVQAYITVSAWVNPSVGVQVVKIIAKHSGSNDIQGTLGIINGYPQFETTTGGTYSSPTGTTVLPLGTWSLVTGVYDGSNSTLYINGAVVAGSAGSGVLANNNFSWTIGSMPAFSGAFAGSIDDARIYNRALTATEIQTLYTAGAS